ncbi:MAG: hypothetical protein HKP41_04495 [Desulfobacterales bacterium]|nr:hypothetical protein [Deltaproteobacteria bacterium]NNK93593.1 hypothetical protein [Desulfobacterales bacterium]
MLPLYVTENERSGVESYLDHIAFTCVNLPVTIQRRGDLGIAYQTKYLQEIDQFQIFILDRAQNERNLSASSSVRYFLHLYL